MDEPKIDKIITSKKQNTSVENREDLDFKAESNKMADVSTKILKNESKGMIDKNKWKKLFALIGIIVVLLFLIIVLVAIPNPEEYEKFQYHGFNFERTTLGTTFIYETSFDILRDDKLVAYSLKLRKDPRTLEKIPANFSYFSKEVYVSFTPESTNCNGTILISAFELGQYLGNLGVNVEAAVTENYSSNVSIDMNNSLNSTNAALPIMNCTNTKSFVIMVKPFSNQTRVYQENKHCIVLEAQDCKVIEVSEKFILELLEKYRESPNLYNLLNS
jgi:hypothetical protein